MILTFYQTRDSSTFPVINVIRTFRLKSIQRTPTTITIPPSISLMLRPPVAARLSRLAPTGGLRWEISPGASRKLNFTQLQVCLETLLHFGGVGKYSIYRSTETKN